MKKLETIHEDAMLRRNFERLNQELSKVFKQVRFFVNCAVDQISYTIDGNTADADVFFIKTDSSATAVTITAASGQTIEGSASITLTAQYQQVLLAYDRGVWYRVAA